MDENLSQTPEQNTKRVYDISTLTRLLKKDFVFVIAVFLFLLMIFADISVYEAFGSVRSRKLEAQNLALLYANEIKENYDNASDHNEKTLRNILYGHFNLSGLQNRGYKFSIYKVSNYTNEATTVFGSDIKKLNKPISVRLDIPDGHYELAVAPSGHWVNIHLVIVLTTLSLLLIAAFTILTLLFLKLRQSNIRLAQLATLDQLTGLYTKQTAIFTLKKEIDYANRNGSQVAVCFIDMNNFKQINDRFGHTTGDTALSKVAKRLMESVRPEDIVARFGGDEFIIIFRGKNTGTDYTSTVERIKAVLNVPAKLSAHVLADISASVGLAVYPTNGNCVEELISYADKAMYEEKARMKKAERINARADGKLEVLRAEK
ncbi:GGDEF domain-containing protein [Treponema bryantii]|uniref:GGDEF domain-containing protein n=1 Tax=Treponema bryantii TaxID=163 RepID=UPI0003B557F1|nr:GGDEF domain-containing protein [Treponema bryantii]